MEKAIHGPCPRLRAEASPLVRHPKKPGYLGVAKSRILRRQAFSTACYVSEPQKLRVLGITIRHIPCGRADPEPAEQRRDLLLPPGIGAGRRRACHSQPSFGGHEVGLAILRHIAAGATNSNLLPDQRSEVERFGW